VWVRPLGSPRAASVEQIDESHLHWVAKVKNEVADEAR